MNPDSSHIKKAPIVSIVMPCFNSAAHIDTSLRSISEQSFQNYELIVVDDASRDDTLVRVEKWRNRLTALKIIESPRNAGPGDARNRGIEAAIGDLVAFIDADDFWFENKLDIQVAVHVDTKCGFSCTAFKFGDKEIFQDRTDYASLLKNNVINTSTVMFDRAQLNVEFEPEYLSEDFIAWLQVSKQTKIHFINKVLVERSEVEGLSANKLQMAYKRWEILRRKEGLGFIKASYFFCHYMASGVLKHYRS